MRTFQQFLAEGADAAKAIHTNVNTSMYIGQNTTDFGKPNILWITGMNSSGGGAFDLSKLGYPIKHISTTVNWPATITGRIKRYPVLKQLIGKGADRRGDAHMSDQVQKVHSELPMNWEPEIVIGTSQGGAVAMACVPLFPQAKFIVGACAWKVFNVKPYLPSGSIIIHGAKDPQVPLADAEELSKITGCKLIVTADGHGINTGAIVQAVKALSPDKHPQPKKPEGNPYLAHLQGLFGNLGGKYWPQAVDPKADTGEWPALKKT